MLTIDQDSDYSAKLRYLAPDDKGIIDYPKGLVGIIRIWNLDTNSPTNFFILIGMFDSTASSIVYNEDVSEEDFEYVNDAIEAIFDHSKVTISRYGNGKRFNMCLKIPEEMILRYTG